VKLFLLVLSEKHQPFVRIVEFQRSFLFLAEAEHPALIFRLERSRSRPFCGVDWRRGFIDGPRLCRPENRAKGENPEGNYYFPHEFSSSKIRNLIRRVN